MDSGAKLHRCVKKSRAFAAIVASLFAAAAWAQVQVSNAWVRGTVAGQQATGAYMRLAAPADSALVAVSTPVAKVAEIHEMKLEGGVMRMHAIPRIPLPAGKPVELKPGGYHVMLMELTRPLKDGEAVPLTLTVQDATGHRSTVEVKATVRPLAGGSSAPPQGHGH